MPHFIIDCSADTLMKVAESKILSAVFKAGQSSGLFADKDIKVRVNPYVRSEVGGEKIDFIHVFGHILEGRNEKQKSDLSQRIVQSLVALFPFDEYIAASIEEFSIAGYCNRNTIEQ